MRALFQAAMFLTLLATTGCAGETLFEEWDSGPADDTGGGKWPDIGARDLGNRDFPTIFACDTIDILFVIDNSESMMHEQQSLAKNFPNFIKAIESIQPKIKSYHIGVISTDIGPGPFSYPKKCLTGGDEGKLQHAPRGTACKKTYPKYLTGPSPTIAEDFACIAQLGLDGCGFEQQFEATLKALTDQPYNNGFLRKNAPLAIIYITDEDDCSAKDTSIFDITNATDKIPSRCVRLLGKLHPVSRYLQKFKALKDNNPRRLLVAAITGPPGTVQLDNNANTGMIPSCTSKGMGEAYPGNRFAEMVKALGDMGLQESLCQGDLSAPLQVIGKAINRACLK